MTFVNSHYWRRKHPVHWMSFTRMHDRVRDNIVPTIHWPKNEEGFKAFMAYVGKVPKKMKRPSIGRKDHSKGYVLGNCGWQALFDNVAEMAKRCNTGRVLTRAHKLKVSEAMIGRTFSEEHRKKLAIAATERIYTEEERRANSRRVKKLWKNPEYRLSIKTGRAKNANHPH